MVITPLSLFLTSFTSLFSYLEGRGRIARDCNGDVICNVRTRIRCPLVLPRDRSLSEISKILHMYMQFIYPLLAFKR